MTQLKVFSAPWCGPCKTMEPALKTLLARGVQITKIDVEVDPVTAAKHGVRSVPTIKVYHGNDLLKSHTGAMTLGQLESFIKL